MKAVLKKNILMMAGIMMIVMFCFGANVYGSTPKVNSLVICGNPLNHAYAKKINNMFKENTYAGYWNNHYSNPLLYSASDSTWESGVTQSEIDTILDKAFSGSEDNDINIFYYIGHGYKGRQGNGYVYGFTLNNGTFTDNDMYYNYFALAQRLSLNYKGKFIVILDSCFSDSFYTYGVSKVAPENQARFTCVACTSQDAQSPIISYYSKCMASGCGYSTYKNLPADRNSDGYITVQEAHDYAVPAAIDAAVSTHSYDILPVRDNAGLANFSLFHHADLNALKSSTTAWILGRSTKIKDAFSVTRNPITKRKMIWKSSNSSIVSVSSTSLNTDTGNYDLYLYGKAPGKAVVQGYLVDSNGTIFEGVFPYSIYVTIKKPSTTLDMSRISLATGETYQLTPTVIGPSKTVKWSSSNTSVATVSSSGRVTLVKKGTATITATANGISATCNVTVHPFDGGSGTKEDPYLVRTLAQLKAVKNYPKRFFRQIADINGGNTVIRQRSLIMFNDEFNGTYDGDGHILQNLTINNGSEDYASIFHNIGANGVVKNLKIKNIKAICNDGGTIFAVWNKGKILNCTLYNCSISNDYGAVVALNNYNTIQKVTVSKCTAARGQNALAVINNYESGVIRSCTLSNSGGEYVQFGYAVWNGGLIDSCKSVGLTLNHYSYGWYNRGNPLVHDNYGRIHNCSFSGCKLTNGETITGSGVAYNYATID